MKTFIKNRDSKDICVVIENADVKTGKLAFVMHGLGGSKDEAQVRAMAEAFIANEYVVVTWDAVHTFGESTGGAYEDATITNYYADLEDVIAWASTQNWYIEPFVLCGHSLGGISTALYAEKHPAKVSALAPIATVVSGALSFEGKPTDQLESWERTGIQVSLRRNGDEKRLKWSHMQDRLKYNLLDEVAALTMPVLLIVGSNDTSTLPAHQKILFDALPGKKEFHIIEGAEHPFLQPHEQQELHHYVDVWLKSL